MRAGMQRAFEARMAGHLPVAVQAVGKEGGQARAANEAVRGTSAVVVAVTRLQAGRWRPLATIALAIALATSVVPPTAAVAQEAAADQGETRRVRVTVQEVAGGRAYLSSGEDEGLHVGARVRFGRRRFRVVGTTSHHAAVEVDQHPLAPGSRGVALVRVADETGGVVRDEVPPLTAFRGQWRPATRPAAGQTPEAVPLGEGLADRPVTAVVTADVTSILPLDDRGQAIHRLELGGRVHAEPWTSAPIVLDGDAALRLWLGIPDGSPGDRSRPYLLVRRFEAGYGDSRSPELHAAIGRLASAARGAGSLDGVRVRTPRFSGFTVGAFGGVIPDPLDGIPLLTSSRFGVELTYENDEARLRPMISAVGQASVFEGQLDEKRARVDVEIFPGESRLGAHSELSLYDADNPWSAGTSELTSAGLDGQVRAGIFEVGARVDLRRPERSLLLDSLLPAGFLCTTDTGADPGTEVCDVDRDPRYLFELDTGIRVGSWDLGVGSTYIRSGAREEADQVGGFVRTRLSRIGDAGFVDLRAEGYRGHFVDSYGGRIETGLQLFDDTLEVALHYRPYLQEYAADLERSLEHEGGLRLRWSPLTELDIGTQAIAFGGEDVSALLLQTAVTYRPL